jgi:hypothetical protein
MKILILESQLNRVFSRDIDELDTKDKTPKGSGSFHYVYNSTQNRDRVFKIARPIDIDEWLTLFKSRPDIFPSVYRVGETKVKLREPKNYIEFVDGEMKYVKHNVGDVMDAKYVELDKLNTLKAQNDWMELDNVITDMTEEAWEFQDYVIHLILMFTKQGGDEDMVDAVTQNMKTEHPEMIKTLNRFVTLIKKICEVKKRPDLHIDNFGYDKDGTLKCLDI